jgi:diguanylate cyclase (GGDEF)-like protein
LVGAGIYAVVVILYVTNSDIIWEQHVDLMYSGLRIILGTAAPLVLAGVWWYSPPSRRVLRVFDWIGAGLLAISFAWLLASLGHLIRSDSLGLGGTLLIPLGWAIWSAAGVGLMIAGIASLSGELLSEQLERRRLQALMDFTRLITRLDYQTVLDETVRHMHDVLHAEACVLYLWDQIEQSLVPSAAVHVSRVYPEEYVRRVLALRYPKGYGITGWVFATGEPCMVGDIHADSRSQPVPGFEDLDQACLVVPIQVEGRRLGVVRMTRHTHEPFTRDDLDLASSFANQAALVIEKARVMKELSDLTITDSLTGLYNARHFEQVLTAELARAARDDRPLALLMVDSDALKRMNDQFGHQKGNDYLQGIARVIREAIRVSDYAFRYAGDEFLVLLPGAGVEEAGAVGERIRRVVEERESLPGIAGTVSVGVAVLPVHARDGEGLLAAADGAMYESKRLGKNRVTAARA